jgi:hypothetical protein
VPLAPLLGGARQARPPPRHHRRRPRCCCRRCCWQGAGPCALPGQRGPPAHLAAAAAAAGTAARLLVQLRGQHVAWARLLSLSSR